MKIFALGIQNAWGSFGTKFSCNVTGDGDGRRPLNYLTVVATVVAFAQLCRSIKKRILFIQQTLNLITPIEREREKGDGMPPG